MGITFNVITLVDGTLKNARDTGLAIIGSQYSSVPFKTVNWLVPNERFSVETGIEHMLSRAWRNVSHLRFMSHGGPAAIPWPGQSLLHVNSDGFIVFSDLNTGEITHSPYRTHVALTRLRPLFSRDKALVSLESCWSGGDERLLQQMAKAFGVPVRGSLVTQRMIVPGMEGSFRTAHPDGSVSFTKRHDWFWNNFSTLNIP